MEEVGCYGNTPCLSPDSEGANQTLSRAVPKFWLPKV